MTMLMGTTMSLAMATVLMSMFWGMKEDSKTKKEEKMGFECGFMNMSASKMNFSTNFIMVIMMFLIFDIEVTILITMTMTSKMSMMEWMLSTTFLMIVTILLMKEWWQGSIDWST